MLRPLDAVWMRICGLSPLKLGPMLWRLVLVLQFLTRSVGIVVLLVRFMGMGIIALAPTLASLAPVTAVAARAKVANPVAKVVPKVIQRVPCLAPM